MSTTLLQSLELHATSSVLNISETTTGLYINETTKDWYFNDTNSTYNVATVGIPITGLTYTLFGIKCCLTLFGLVGNGLIIVSMFRFKDKLKGHGKLITPLAVCDLIANSLSALLLTMLLNHSINFILYNVFDSEFRRNIFAVFYLKKKDGTPEILMGELNVDQTGVVSVGS